MTTTLPHKKEKIPDTVFLRPRDPDDHRQFEEVLPWFTPLFVYGRGSNLWVRWSVPKPVGERMGLPSDGCDCCGSKSAVVEDDDGFQVDTAWNETSWWLEANGYALPKEIPTEGSN